jgi:hypothetical protein
MSVVIKGLPADHSLSTCMGVYIEQAEYIDGRPAFVGGCCNDMLLSFTNILGWEICDKENSLTVFLYSKCRGSLALPHLVTSGWAVCEQRKDPSSIRVEKFKKRETMLKLSGGQDFGYGVICEGIYRKMDRIHDGKPTYGKDDKAIWFEEGFGWCIGIDEAIGNESACACCTPTTLHRPQMQCNQVGMS